MTKKYYTIGEVAKILNVKTYNIRYWESVIPQLKPSKILNGIRHYQENEIEKLKKVKELIYEEKLSVESVNKFFNEYLKKEKLKKELKEILKLLEN